ncbi:hypothetical protein GW17_00000846 [Ensete ventricosum]|nr:hypothetical protein GW17_00000846 [Ensete ventricosum]
MEGEVGAQVAPSVFFHQHQALPGPFHEAPLLAKKRDFPWKNNPNFPHGQEQEIQRHRLMGVSLPSHGGNWNPRMWDWDGGTFTAKPSTDASEVLHPGSQPSSYAAAAVVDQRKGDEGPKDSTFGRNLAEDDQNLALKLGGGAFTVDEPAARPNKRVRSGSPGSSGNYPMCQVDDCKADLSSAKDYHKRHKVCEVHSKTAKALVGKQMQRFCQQCSRRRLAGHNRRRRKTLPDDVSSKLLPPRSQESTTNGNLDIVNLLAIFARLQAGVLTNKCPDRSGVEVPCRIVQKARQSLPLQLFGPADDESPAELASTVKYLSSESSNPMEERSPSSSPPVTKKLFPLHSTMERQKYAQASECQEDNATIELSVSHGRSAQLQHFKESDTLVEDGAAPSATRRAAYRSSGSDHSPSSSNSGAQDRTGRITFKLFGKDPSCFPDTLRAQLEDDLLQRVTSLVQYSDTEFWRNGRFLAPNDIAVNCSKNDLATFWNMLFNSPCSRLSFEFHSQVENGFKGNSFPVIIADANICQELRALESDFDEDVQTADAIPEEQVHCSVQPRSRADVMHFLNELGWLFQRTNASSSRTLPDFSITRLKYLFTFSVERDWCNLIKTLLDILVERSLRNDASKQESLEMLSEVHLLIRAVNRKSKQMIDLLLHYCVCHGEDATKVYLFPPNMAGPGGMTPLHMAAYMQDAEDIVDALTNDPQEVRLILM